ncbi:MAG TPA: aquaporin [Candidatus Chromulinivoraceae bacterium]|nr:aquaporin [Candidatus Chromulinivoraceae bacterium]
MATKKAASSAKKSTNKSTAAKQTMTKVTTVKAVESRPVMQAASSPKKRSLKFGLSRTPLVGALIAEFLGTFILAGAVIAGQGQPILVFFALAGVVLTIGTISGGYANPALVLGAWVTKRMSGIRALAYIVAEVLGAMLALVILDAYVNNAPAGSSASTYASSAQLFKAAAIPQGKEWFIFLSEFIGAIIFGFAVAGATREKKERTAAALTVGLGAFLGLMMAGSAATMLGGSAILNPALAVALQAIDFASVWPILVYVIGASLGAIIGFVLYDLIRTSEEPEEKAAY